MRKSIFLFFLCAMMLPVTVGAEKLSPGGDVFPLRNLKNTIIYD
jgi:hypothetical protein